MTDAKEFVEIHFPKISLSFGDCSFFNMKPNISWTIGNMSSFITTSFSDNASDKEQLKSGMREDYHKALDKALDYYIKTYVEPELDKIGVSNGDNSDSPRQQEETKTA